MVRMLLRVFRMLLHSYFFEEALEVLWGGGILGLHTLTANSFLLFIQRSLDHLTDSIVVLIRYRTILIPNPVARNW